MSTEAILVLVLALLLALLITNIPISMALLTSGVVGLLLMRGGDYVTSVLGALPFSTTSKYTLLVVPMYVLLGMFALKAHLAEDLVGAASRILKRVPGGLGLAAVGASAGFSAVTGSSIATVATIGNIAINQMANYGYRKGFAAAVVAAGGTLGVLIPPSVLLVVYGVITEESIGRLLLAGVIPGILTALTYAAVVVCLVRFRPGFAQVPEGVVESPIGRAHEAIGTRNYAGTIAVVQVMILFAIVMGGLYLGIATATESGAVAALVALVILVVRLRSSWSSIWQAVRAAVMKAVVMTAMIMMLLVGAAVFNNFLIVGGVPADLTRWVTGLELPSMVILILLCLFLVPLGMFLDSMSLVVVVVPLIYTPITAMGYDGVWLGIIVIKLVEIGMLTPPVGMNVFVAAGTTQGVRAQEVFIRVIPFVLAEFALVAFLLAAPQVTLWLPDTAFG